MKSTNRRTQSSRGSRSAKGSRTSNGRPRSKNSRAGKTRNKRSNARKDPHLRVSFDRADQIRQRLLSDEVFLSSGDVRTLISILNDVYPVRSERSKQVWQPLLIGMGIGIVLLMGLTMI
jgi:hypothetical protein